MAKVLITGGAGFIGSNVVKSLMQAGYEAVVLDDLSYGYRQNLLPGVEFIQGDVRDSGIVEQAVQGCEVIFHLAASVGIKRSLDAPVTDSSINILGTLNILEAARKYGVRKVVYSSSVGIFGEPQTPTTREDHPQQPTSPYGISKLAAEKMCLVYNLLYDMQNVCLRYFNVYGPNQRYDAYGGVIPIFSKRILKRQPLTIFGDGLQTRDFINVRDVASANLAAAFNEGVKDVFNIGSGNQIKIKDLADWLQELAGIQVGIQYLPPRLGDILFSQADIGKARETFGFEPTIEIKDGLAEYLAWIKDDEFTRVHLWDE